MWLSTKVKKLSQYFSSKNSIPTTLDILKGQKGILTVAIEKDTITPGLVKLDGEIWNALSKDNISIPVGTIIKVVEIKGIYLIVSPVE